MVSTKVPAACDGADATCHDHVTALTIEFGMTALTDSEVHIMCAQIRQRAVRTVLQLIPISAYQKGFTRCDGAVQRQCSEHGGSLPAQHQPHSVETGADATTALRNLRWQVVSMRSSYPQAVSLLSRRCAQRLLCEVVLPHALSLAPRPSGHTACPIHEPHAAVCGAPHSSQMDAFQASPAPVLGRVWIVIFHFLGSGAALSSWALASLSSAARPHCATHQ